MCGKMVLPHRIEIHREHSQTLILKAFPAPRSYRFVPAPCALGNGFLVDWRIFWWTFLWWLLAYLDTQDYSRFADAVYGKAHVHLLPIYNELLDLANAGSVRFCFSQVLVSELLQVAPASFEIAKRKAKIVENLCGSRAFPNPFWVFKTELKALVPELAVRRPEQEILDVVANGRWFYEELAAAGSISAFDPRASAPWYVRFLLWLLSGRLNEDMARAAMKASPMYLAAQGGPLEQRIIDYLLRRVSGPELANELANTFAKVTKLVAHPELAAPLRGLNEGVQKFGYDMMAMVQTFQREMDEAAVKIGRPPPPEVFSNLAREYLPGMWVRLARRPNLISGPPALVRYVKSQEFDTGISRLRFVLFFVELLSAILLRMGMPAKNQKKPTRGDGGDLLHALYAPYCQVMRVDASFADLAKPIAARFGCKIVGRIEELPGVLRKRILASTF